MTTKNAKVNKSPFTPTTYPAPAPSHTDCETITISRFHSISLLIPSSPSSIPSREKPCSLANRSSTARRNSGGWTSPRRNDWMKPRESLTLYRKCIINSTFGDSWPPGINRQSAILADRLQWIEKDAYSYLISSPVMLTWMYRIGMIFMDSMWIWIIRGKREESWFIVWKCFPHRAGPPRSHGNIRINSVSLEVPCLMMSEVIIRVWL